MNLSNLQILPRQPEGRFEIRCRMRRFVFDELKETKFTVAAASLNDNVNIKKYYIAKVKVNDQAQNILINRNSVHKRFDLPPKIISSNLLNLSTVIRLVQEKRRLQIHKTSCIPIFNHRSLMPLEMIADIAQQEKKCFRLSKQCYRLKNSIDVHPGGFIATDLCKDDKFGKISVTPSGLPVIRKVMVISRDDEDAQEKIKRIEKCLNEWKGKTRPFGLLSMGMYENKYGNYKLVYFHPCPEYLIRDKSSISLEQIEEMKKISKTENICIRISSQVSPYKASIDIHPELTTTDMGNSFGSGSSAKVKKSVTSQREYIARRSFFLGTNFLDELERIFRIARIFNAFKGKPGILNTLSMGVYHNKHRQLKFVSFHPLFDHDLKGFFQRMPLEKDRFKMIHELLQGLNAIADQGRHRDLSFSNILLRTKNSFQAAISDLEYFRFHEERNSSPLLGYENYEMKEDVCKLGYGLLNLLMRGSMRFTYDDLMFNYYSFKTQKDLENFISEQPLNPQMKVLLLGMLNKNSIARWTASQSLEHFERHFLNRSLA